MVAVNRDSENRVCLRGLKLDNGAYEIVLSFASLSCLSQEAANIPNLEIEVCHGCACFCIDHKCDGTGQLALGMGGYQVTITDANEQILGKYTFKIY